MEQLRKTLAETHDSTIRQEEMLRTALASIEKHETRIAAVEAAVNSAKAQVSLIKWLVGFGFAAVGVLMSFLRK